MFAPPVALMPLVPLDALQDPAIGGRKAARLAALRREGFPVPDGVVVPPDAEIDRAALEALYGHAAVAVRSSGVREDTAEASYAGMYETVLDVRGADAIVDAIARVRASGDAARVAAYGPAGPLAVLVQPMIAARCAGVAFSADPVTGDRSVARVSAVPGLGAALVDGTALADEWTVGEQAVAVRRPHATLDEAGARAIAALARAVAERAGSPQDIEWAHDGERLWLLQARPMTALPEPVAWTPPTGGWMRSFRLGEYLASPPTPLFHSWGIERLERAFMAVSRAFSGCDFKAPWHVLVNGWYFSSPMGSSGESALLGMLRRPRILLTLPLLDRRPDLVAHLILDRLAVRWENQLLPALLREVELAGQGDPEPIEAAQRVDRLLDCTGEYFGAVIFVGGAAWKMEAALARFYRKHLDGVLEHGHQTLVTGLSEPAPPPPHAVAELDWSAARPALPWVPVGAEAAGRRQEAEEACRARLRGRRLRIFNRLLAVAQRYARLREAQVRDLTAAWPRIHELLGRIARALVERGILDTPEQLHYLTREELARALDGDPTPRQEDVRARRLARERSRRLLPPPVIGTLPPFLTQMVGGAMRDLTTRRASREGCAVEGLPASPGIAEGRVVVLHSLDDAGRLRTGDVLVCPLPAPAWTPLFARAAAVVTDAGTLAAHASLVARELGVPAVVATGDATARLRDGERVRVDGGLGVVFRIAADCADG